MFETRLHLISENDALNKRKLWEGFLQWANRFSALDSDNIARLQFENSHFTANTFIEQTVSGFISSGDSGLVGNDSGTLIALSAGVSSLEISGSYWMTWSVDARTDDSRFAAAVPFVGDKLVGCAQDFKAEMGWYNNMSVSEAVSRGPFWANIGGGADGADKDQAFEYVYDNYDQYGKLGYDRHTRHSQVSKTKIESHLANSTTVAKVHLSGSGSGVVGRVTGNIGIIVYAFPGSTFSIIGSTLTVRRRNR